MIDVKDKVYLTTRQTTENGTAVNIVEVTGTDIKEAIQMAKAIENFKANGVLYAYADVRQLLQGSFIIDKMEWDNLPLPEEEEPEE